MSDNCLDLKVMYNWLPAKFAAQGSSQSGITAVQIWVELAAVKLNLKALIDNQQVCCTVFTSLSESPLH